MVVNLDRHWKESKREEERLRGRREMEALAARLNPATNVGRT